MKYFLSWKKTEKAKFFPLLFLCFAFSIIIIMIIVLGFFKQISVHFQNSLFYLN